MKLLLHICCAPCALMPVRQLRGEGVEITGYFYNPNIHPYTEQQRRLETLQNWAEGEGLALIVEKDYDPVAWFRRTAYREGIRCRLCHMDRLSRAANVAQRGRFDAFSSTLLYSVRQKHNLLKETGVQCGQARGIPFLPRDFRPFWREGVLLSKELGLYRQQYCGCLYSEGERYLGPAAKAWARDTSGEREGQ